MKEITTFNIWIEAESWIPGTWQADDGNTDVVVTKEDGSKWIASFFSYKNIASLVEKNKRSGECLHGQYFWSSDMLLVEEISRPLVEAVIAELITASEFEHVFTHILDDEEAYEGKAYDK